MSTLTNLVAKPVNVQRRRFVFQNLNNNGHCYHHTVCVEMLFKSDNKKRMNRPRPDGPTEDAIVHRSRDTYDMRKRKSKWTSGVTMTYYIFWYVLVKKEWHYLFFKDIMQLPLKIVNQFAGPSIFYLRDLRTSFQGECHFVNCNSKTVSNKKKKGYDQFLFIAVF